MTTYERVRRVLAEVLGIPEDGITPSSTFAVLLSRAQPRDSITPPSSFVHRLGRDALNVVEFTLALEDEFGLEFTDEEVSAADRMDGTSITLQEIAEYIDRKRKQSTGSSRAPTS